MFETVDGSLEVRKKVGRENFGLIYEPANWMIADEDYGRRVAEKLGLKLDEVRGKEAAQVG